MSELSETAIWRSVEKRLDQHANLAEKPITLVFTCERHAAQGARSYLNQTVLAADHHSIEVLPLPCVAAVSPALVSRALTAGAGDVRLVGCPADDCARREGNLWAEGRLNRTRLPRLKKAFENAPIQTFWLAPDAFSHALPVLEAASAEGFSSGYPASQLAADQSRLAAAERKNDRLTWRNFLPVFIVLGLVMAVQVWASRSWVFAAYPAQEARLQLVMPDPHLLGYAADRFTEKYADIPTHLVLSDGERVVFDQIYPFSENYISTPLVVEARLTPGEHHFSLRLVGENRNAQVLELYDRAVILKAGQVWIIQYDHNPGPD